MLWPEKTVPMCRPSCKRHGHGDLSRIDVGGRNEFGYDSSDDDNDSGNDTSDDSSGSDSGDEME
jgi:hypothetical protein